MNEILNFNLSNIHIDYSLSLRNAFLTEGIFKKKTYNNSLLFSFCAKYSQKIKLYGIIKKK